eukprot:jgi/Astpho2/8727/fgenesh1_pg.00128_%23_26_t
MLIALIVQTSASHASQSQHPTAALKTLLEWAPLMGIKCPNIGPYISPSGLQGMAAIQDIRADEVVISTPLEATIKARQGQSNPIPHLVSSKHWQLISEQQHADQDHHWQVTCTPSTASDKHEPLTLLLLSEVLAGPRSKFQVYLQYLPQEYDILLLWAPEELQELQDPVLEAEARGWGGEAMLWNPPADLGEGCNALEPQLQVREDLQRVQAGYRLLHRQPIVKMHNVTLEQYQWAVATCRSRSFAIPQAPLLGVGAAPLMVTLLIVSLSLGTSFAQESIPHSRLLLSGCQVLMAAIVAWWIIDQRLLGHAQPVVALVPVADALNHHHQSQTEFVTSRQPAFQVVAGAGGFHLGQEVDDSYGRKSHAEFLTGYGFLPTTEVDEYGIDLLTLLQSRPDFPQERLGALVTTGGSIVLETLQKAKVSGHGLAPGSRAAVRALLCSQEEWEAFAAISPVRWLQDAVSHRLVPSALSFFQLPRNASLEHVVTQVTQDCCRAALDGKATSLQQDQEVLEQSASKRFRHRLTVQYRIGLKQALAKCAAL